jgi:glycosyltransferase involved in cell wall biosynthesis
MLGRATHFSATSSATRALLAPLTPADSTIDVVYAGVPDDLFDLERREEGYILYFGRIDIFHKGLDVLLDAISRLAREKSGLRIRIAGRGKDAAALAKLVGLQGLGDIVEIMGEVTESERQALFAGASVQVMPSRFEGFGMVAAEAMAAGVPLVAASVGSLPEVVDTPAGGVLVPSGDAGALAEAIGRLLDSDHERAALSESARRSAERFRWDAVAADHLNFLRRIASDRSSFRTIHDQ